MSDRLSAGSREKSTNPGREDQDSCRCPALREKSITSSAIDGSVTWRSPAGKTYDLPPPGLLSDG